MLIRDLILEPRGFDFTANIGFNVACEKEYIQLTKLHKITAGCFSNLSFFQV